MKTTFYDRLGVRADASIEQISDAYRAALQRLENNPRADSNARTLINDAYRVLSDPARRAQYDASLRASTAVRRADIPTANRGYNNVSSNEKTRYLQRRIVALGVFGLAVLLVMWLSAKRDHSPQQATTERNNVSDSHPAQTPSTERNAKNNEASNLKEKSASQLYQDNVNSIVLITVRDSEGEAYGSGSGVVIDKGVVITNCHVVKNADEIDVKSGEHHYSASIDVQDEAFDLCRLNVFGLQAPAVTISKNTVLKIGQKTYAIGAPRGLESTLSEGIVSSLREVENSQGDQLIQTTASASPGSSGGGLFDEFGELIGIVTFQFVQGQNLNFAVPASWISRVQNRHQPSLVGSAQPLRPNRKEPNEPATPLPPTPQQMILGEWSCHGAVTGIRVTFNFFPNQTMFGTIRDDSFSGRYYLSKDVLLIQGARSLSIPLEELSSDKFVIRLFEKQRVICNR